MMAGRLVIPFFAVFLLLVACNQAPTWKAEHFRDHPLAGRIWHVTEARFITRSELHAELSLADYILLGETHDNPDHHLLQAEIVTAMATAGRRPVLAFEMFDQSQASELEAYLSTSSGDASGIAEAVRWNQSGWPDWAIYQPVAAAGLRAGLTLHTASMGRSDARLLFQSGITGTLPKRFQSLHLDRPLPKMLKVSLRREIEHAHCGYAPKEMISAMAFAQFARDAHMALRISNSGQEDGAILIAGAGHVRNDRGVPFHLRRMAPGSGIVSLGFIEIIDTGSNASAYSEYFGGKTMPFDFIWFTPRVDIRDACERFKEQLEKMKGEN